MDMVTQMCAPPERSWQTRTDSAWASTRTFSSPSGVRRPARPRSLPWLCGVREDCLEYALANGDNSGSGGLSGR